MPIYSQNGWQSDFLAVRGIGCGWRRIVPACNNHQIRSPAMLSNIIAQGRRGLAAAQRHR